MMPTTPPRHVVAAASGTEMVTPATPRYGPMFDPDHYALLDRRQQKKKRQQQSDQYAQRSRPQRRGSTEVGADDDAGTRSRTRTRTRTISGAQPGVQMVTPRETPYRRRRRQCDLDLAMTEEAVEDDPCGSGIGQGKAVARVLFPSTPDQTTTAAADDDDEEEAPVVDYGVDEFGSIRTDRKMQFSIYKDPTTDGGVFDEFADDPFVTGPGTVAKKRSRQSVPSDWPDPSKKGMAFVFRGKKIFRPFPTDDQYSDDEFAIGPVKPRILFPQASSGGPDGSLDSSQPTSSSTIFDDSVADSTTDVSTQDSSTSIACDSKRDSGVGMYDLDRTRARTTSGSSQDDFGGNPEEEETDIENYYSP
ncbi:hypothetical protein V1517DRAFT_319977 [Lipomyces orientalis]|uniref:Uncharacterized protein n=1 Tax=Lipomyces orientalis TaxID=1233043 RepID=A0ACC3TRW2_9ASCO